MRSIELALARDFTRRGAIVIPLVFLGMIALPLWILKSSDIFRSFLPTSPEAVVLHVTLTLAMGFVAAVAVFQAQGRLARFFVRPISATRLVICQMTLGMATIALLYLGSASLLNLGGVGWPLVGPALFLATTLACALAAIWSLEGTVLGQFIGCTITTWPLVIWFSRCYGATIMGDWHTMWRNPTAGETLTLGGITAAAFFVAIVGVTRTRRGDLWDFAAVQAWWERQRTRGYAASRFSGPTAAQSWSEWREKLGPAPAGLLALAMLEALGAWIAGRMPTKEMLAFTLSMPPLLLSLVIPLIFGLIIGNCGREAKSGMKHMLATRPVTDAFLAKSLLRISASALLWAWGTWLVGMMAVAGLAWLAGHRDDVVRGLTPGSFDVPQALLIVLFPLTSWILTSLVATLAATGRAWLWSTVLFGAFGLMFVFFLVKGCAPAPVFEVLINSWLVLSGGLYLGGTVWAYVAAARKRLISAEVILPAVAAWAVASVIAACVWPEIRNFRGVSLWHALGWLALGILPFAAMPLAIRWNRHR